MPRVLLNRCLAGVLLLLVSPPALAQKVPLWVVAGVLSPVLALVLVIALALCAPGLGKAGLHIKLLALWIVAFLLASFFIENDWVIWTPMHLYILHLALLPIFVFYQLLRRLEPSAVAPSRSLLLGFLSVLLSVPTTLFVTSLSVPAVGVLRKGYRNRYDGYGRSSALVLSRDLDRPAVCHAGSLDDSSTREKKKTKMKRRNRGRDRFAQPVCRSRRAREPSRFRPAA